MEELHVKQDRSWDMLTFSENVQKLLHENKYEKIKDSRRSMGMGAWIICIRALKGNAILKAEELGDPEVAHLINTYFY